MERNRRMNIGAAAHERQRHHINAVRHAEPQIGEVFFRQ